MTCPCGSSLDFTACCGPILSGEQPAPSAEAMMRARYTAYTRADIDFIMNSTHPDARDDSDVDAMRAWSENAEWLNLEVLQVEAGGDGDSRGLVEFIAHYNMGGIKHHHHEVSGFVRSQLADGSSTWLFQDGKPLHSGPSEKPKPIVNEVKIGRNDPCSCGSGKKFKKCCGA